MFELLLWTSDGRLVRHRGYRRLDTAQWVGVTDVRQGRAVAWRVV